MRRPGFDFGPAWDVWLLGLGMVGLVLTLAMLGEWHALGLVVALILGLYAGVKL